MLGASVAGNSPEFYAFWGTIDELSIYKGALSASDIESIYSAGKYGKCLGIAPSSCHNLRIKRSN